MPDDPHSLDGTPPSNTGKPLSLFLAVAPLLTMLALFAVGLVFLDMGTELLVLVMLGAATVASLIANRTGATWTDIQRATGEKIAAAFPMLVILLTIGMLIGTWVAGGTIPTLVYWGVKLVRPELMILTAFLATAVMSLCTGTSWGSAGTIGVALMGMAHAIGAPLAPTAGAVISGAYLGDKMSPLSDTTNICAIGAGADLYAHIRHMLYTAVPSFVLCVVVYAIAGVLGPAASDGLPADAQRLLDELDHFFTLSWVALLPPILVIVSLVRKVPAAPAMALSSVVAMLLGVLVQGFQAQHVLLSAVNGFDLSMIAQDASPSPAFATLVVRGGLVSMVGTLLLVFAAFLMAGAMEASGALGVLIRRMLAGARSVFGLIAATMASGAAMVALTSHGGVTALVVGGLFQRAYEERNLASVNLSRSLEDSVTITEPLMPWTVSAVFMANTLGVPTLEYLPWAVFCLGGSVFSLLYAAMYSRWGVGIRRVTPVGSSRGA